MFTLPRDVLPRDVFPRCGEVDCLRCDAVDSLRLGDVDGLRCDDVDSLRCCDKIDSLRAKLTPSGHLRVELLTAGASEEQQHTQSSSKLDNYANGSQYPYSTSSFLDVHQNYFFSGITDLNTTFSTLTVPIGYWDHK